MSDTNEEQLLKLLSDETTLEAGFQRLMDLYQERLYWHIRKFVWDHEDANDVLQNTMIKVFKGLPSFKGQSKLYTWLYKIASNEAMTFINKQKRKPTASMDQEAIGIKEQLRADTYFDGSQAQYLLQHALSTLPDKQRLVFNMRYYDDLPYQDISEILDTSVGALKASYHHAVKKIEHFFKQTASNPI